MKSAASEQRKDGPVRQRIRMRVLLYVQRICFVIMLNRRVDYLFIYYYAPEFQFRKVCSYTYISFSYTHVII